VTDLLGPGYHVVHQTDREAGRGGDIEDGQGNSIASRWPLGEVWEPDLNVTPRTEDFACGTIIVEVFAPEPVGLLLFVNHLPNWQLAFEHERELQTVVVGRAIEEIAESRDLHVILAGDLDATPDAAAVNGDIFTLDYIRDRILPTLDSADVARINTVLGALQGVQSTMSAKELATAANAA
jgi:endonuclease/exonuclease/phosphatase family metal-dependent hydrolase